MHEEDEQHLRRAIRLAMNGRGRVEPNPMVGCVIVSRDGRVIGEGFHEQFGGPHAEPNALASCTESPAGATAYVTLEPCCHTNKKTPPCTPRLIEAKVGRIVVGCLDPNPEVNGKGLAQLRAAGIRVDAPVLENEAKQLIAPFLARTQHQRPYATLKWAETANGKIGAAGGRRLLISNQTSLRFVHRLRARCDAILVGARTVLADDPLLTVRDVEPLRPLLRVVVDRDLSVPVTARVVTTAPETPTVFYCAEQSIRARQAQVTTLRGYGVEVVPLKAADKVPRELSVPAMLRELHDRDCTHLLIEPGRGMAASFMAYADRVWIFRSPTVLNDEHAPAATRLEEICKATGRVDLSGDTLTEYLNPASPVFFAAVPSADFVLAAEAVAAGRL